jgi:hypothetical protein
MRTDLDFRSRKFPSYRTESEGVNWESVWGKRVAEYLSERLPQHGFEVKDIYAEDWGWCVEIDNPEFSTWLGCSSLGVEDEDEDEDEDEENPDALTGFVVHLHPDKPVIRKLFKKIDTTSTMERLADAVQKIFWSDAEVIKPRWLGADDGPGGWQDEV